MNITLPREIRSNYDGFATLIDLFSKAQNLFFDSLDIRMNQTTWFDANMAAPFGAILYKIGREMNEINLLDIPSGVQNILSKNGFLTHYGGLRKVDTYGTTIEYHRFEPQDVRYFATYIEKHWGKKGLPQMTTRLRKKFRESIFEIFSNSVSHSRTRLGIFSCGQFYPNYQRLDFSIADLGLGIKHNVESFTNRKWSAGEAIEWAMIKGNTTRRESIPGGLGLKLLQEFIKLNQGKIQVVSDKGFWELAKGKVNKKKFSTPFPGTVVNIEINTADKKTYSLASETQLEDIF